MSFFIHRVLFSLQYRYIPSRWYYPKEVREALSGIRNPRTTASSVRGRQELGIRHLKIQEAERSMGHGRLKLATEFLEYKGKPEWHKEFDDPEQTMSLHRWGWLIYDGMDKEQGLALMRSWLSVMGAVPRGVAGTPYTTGERIINALLYLRRTVLRSYGGRSSVPDDICTALLIMAFHVARNIEYHGVRGTGNHVVNNARALFFAGQILGVHAFSTLALAVLKDALPWLVTKDGFLREESSHYHLLFTRWLIEIYELAKETHNDEVQSYLAPWVKKCAERCWFFLVRNEQTGAWQIPLIGDVSPDCTPEWLIQYLLSCLQPYAPSPQPLSHGERETEGRVRGMQAFPQSGWFRLDRGSLAVFWHVPQTNMIHRATHGHGDVCSFVLFFHGKPIVIDPGRPTYKTDDHLYVYSGSARAHNSLTIDGFDPFLYDRAQKFPTFYQKRKAETNWKEEAGHFVFSIAHTGFQRIKGDMIDHVRRFRISDRSLTVEDELRGTRAHTIETFFHFAPGTDKIDVQHSKGELKTIPGWTFPSYGVKIPSPIKIVYCQAQLPQILHYKLSWPA